jgi:hypothetical protein
MCNGHYLRLKRHGSPGTEPIRLHASPGEPLRFLHEVVLPYQGDACLLWQFARDDFGYAMIKQDGRQERVHCVVCAIVHGPRPGPEFQVRHLCQNGEFGCVSPSHLVYGTQADNQADRHRRRRMIDRSLVLPPAPLPRAA